MTQIPLSIPIVKMGNIAVFTIFIPCQDSIFKILLTYLSNFYWQSFTAMIGNFSGIWSYLNTSLNRADSELHSSKGFQALERGIAN